MLIDFNKFRRGHPRQFGTEGWNIFFIIFFSILEKRGLQGELRSALKYLWESHQEDGAKILTELHSRNSETMAINWNAGEANWLYGKKKIHQKQTNKHEKTLWREFNIEMGYPKRLWNCHHWRFLRPECIKY